MTAPGDLRCTEKLTGHPLDAGPALRMTGELEAEAAPPFDWAEELAAVRDRVRNRTGRSEALRMVDLRRECNPAWPKVTPVHFTGSRRVNRFRRLFLVARLGA
jgi:hypothetical protein